MADNDGILQPGAPATDSLSNRAPIRMTLLCVLAAGVFVVSFVFRLLYPLFTNDHFFYLSRARQILLGDLPFRDFVDHGAVLTHYASTAAQALFGYRLLGEALLDCFFLSAGATLTFFLATRASRSLGVGLLVTLLQIAIAPRLFNYPKIFLPVAALLFFWRYVDTRKGRDLVVTAIWTALAFLFRHDYGVYLALAALAMVTATHWKDGLRPLLGRLTLYAASVGVLLMPFFIFLALNGGIVAYFRTGVEWSRKEATRSWLRKWPSFRLGRSGRQQVWPRINVIWAKGVTPEVQAVLEHRYHLRKARFLGDDPRGSIWQYDLLNASESNISVLLKDPRVKDTHGIDRATSQVTPPAEPVLVSWLRRLPFLGHTDAPGLFHQANAAVWLYYVFVSLPVLAVLVLLLKHYRPWLRAELLPSETPKILCAAVLCAAISLGFLRHPLTGRVADAAGPTAVLGGWLLGRWLAISPARQACPQGARHEAGDGPETPHRRLISSLFQALSMITLVVILGLTGLSVMAVAEDGVRFKRSAVSSPTEFIHHAGRVLRELRTSPPIDAWDPPGLTGRPGLARYVRACTTPTDRLLVTWFAPELFFFSGRGFAGGHVAFYFTHHSSSADQQVTLRRLQTQSVPIVLAEVTQYEHFRSTFGRIHEYLMAHYQVARESDFGDERKYRVLVDRRLVPSGTYEPLSLPCFK